jgi:hypothetical protein
MPPRSRKRQNFEQTDPTASKNEAEGHGTGIFKWGTVALPVTERRNDNSPAIYGWVMRPSNIKVPRGTAEKLAAVCKDLSFCDGRLGLRTPWESGGGPPQSKTLARWPVMLELREASWSAPALWRFGTGTDLVWDGGWPCASTQTPWVWLISGCPVGTNAAAKIILRWTIGRDAVGKRRRAAAVQDAGALTEDARMARSVLECASPLALWDGTEVAADVNRLIILRAVF